MKEFYTTQEVEEKLHKSRTTVARLAVKHGWQVEKRKANGTIKSFYAKKDVDEYLGVPAIPEVQAKEEKARTVALAEYRNIDELPSWNQDIAWARYYLCIQLQKDYEEMLGSKEEIIQSFVKEASKRFPKQFEVVKKMSVGTLRRWWGVYQKNQDNPLALATNYGKSRGCRKMTMEIAERVKRIYLSKNKLSMKTVYTMICQEYGMYAVSYATVRNYINQDLSSLVKDYARMTEKEFKDTHMPYLSLDYSTKRPNDLWVSDGHDMELLCRHPFKKNSKGERIIRSPKWVLWMDVKTRMVTGWTLSWNETTESIALALKNGIERWGRPKAVYTDNGKAYKGEILKGNELKETQGIYAALGIDKDNQIHAIPYNAQAKSIERIFVDFKNDFARRFLTYKGGNPLERPDLVKKIAKDLELGKLVLEQEELETILAGYVEFRNHMWYKFPGRNGHRGHGMNGRTPLEAFNEELPENERFMIPEDKLRLLFLYEDVRTIGQNGITFLDNMYAHPSLYLYLKEKVKIKYDPHDLKFLYVYKMSGEFLCKAEKFNKVGSTDIGQYKMIGKMRKDLRKLVNKELEVRAELSHVPVIEYIEETVKRKEILENRKEKSIGYKEKDVIKVGSLEFPVEGE